jgi:ABC-2 type transport system permease protein/sodium transport system permease protein
MAALGLASRVFGTDAVLYGSRGSWGDLFRRPAQPQAAPTLPGAMFCLALLFPAYFLLSNLLARWGNTNIANRLAMMGIATALLFAGIPLLAALWRRARLVSTFGLRAPSQWSLLWALPGAAILGLSLWPFAHELVLLSRYIGLATLSDKQIESVQQMVAQWRQGPFWLLLASIAIAPAVCEELFFRGYLFSGFRQRLPDWATAIISALLFSLFHVVVVSTLATERLLPSALLGLALAWVRVRGGSVYPSILLHACHNALLISVAYWQPELADLGLGSEEKEHLPPGWLAAAAVGLVVGGALIWMAGVNRTSRSSSLSPTLAAKPGA